MNRRQLLFGTLLAPLVKPLASLLPATAVRDLVPGGLPKPVVYHALEMDQADRILFAAMRRANAAIEDELLNGRKEEAEWQT